VFLYAVKNQTPENTFWKCVFIMVHILFTITKPKRFDVWQYVWFHLQQGIIAGAEFWMGFPVLNFVKCSASCHCVIVSTLQTFLVTNSIT
jgi:hypothetical protein